MPHIYAVWSFGDLLFWFAIITIIVTVALIVIYEKVKAFFREIFDCFLRGRR